MLNHKPFKNVANKLPAFTIIELLVTIVIIGVLATITIVSYSGLTERATVASLKTDLTNASRKLQLYYVEHDSVYPQTMINDGNGNYCPTPEDTKYCIKPSSGNIFNYVAADPYTTYTLTASKPGSPSYVITPQTPPTLAESESSVPSNWKQIAAGTSSTCAISTEDYVFCWGSSAALGNGTFVISQTPVPVVATDLGTPKSISAGSSYMCAINMNDDLYCWGTNTYGQLGNNSTANSSVPVAVDTTGLMNNKKIKTLATAYYHTCALTFDNLIYCWGRNNYGQLGDGTLNQSTTPVLVVMDGELSGKTVVDLKAGGSSTCAVIAEDGGVYCWGYNYSGQLGNGTFNNSLVPTVAFINGVERIAVSALHVCATSWDDVLFCWGSNSNGQLGINNATLQSETPVLVDPDGAFPYKSIQSISVGAGHTCAVDSTNVVYCWGKNNFGQLGNNSLVDNFTPGVVDTSGVLNNKAIISVTSGTYNNFVKTTDSEFYSWGYNNNAVLGNNSTVNSTVPVFVNTVN